MAEDSAGQLIGYARSILNEGVRELTEFFVLPGQQSAGVGAELLARAFPAAGASRRFIIATSDARALARYLKAGVYPRFPIYEFRRAPQAVAAKSDLRFAPMAPAGDDSERLAAIDQAVLGYRRNALHAWLATQRAGFMAWRGPDPVGYGYVGDDMGPVAALAETDLPALLAHAERQAHARGLTEIGFEVPLINRAAVDYLLARGFQMQRFFAFLMSDEPFGAFERYVVYSPPFFV